MPQIEELHTSTKAAAPGWSYVVDTGYDPSKAAINPTNRKRLRTAAAETTSAGDLTLRQQTAIQRHLDELDKDNHKDVQIPIPKSKLDGSKSRKETTNVRRVLTSGKAFAYYIAEEEALLAQKGGADPTTTTTAAATAAAATGGMTETNKPKPAQRASKTPIARRKNIIMPTAAAPGPSSTESSPAPSSSSAAMAPPLIPATRGKTATGLLPQQQTPVPCSDLLLDPVPAATISEAEIEALLSAPPLTYNAARSAPPPPGSAPPKRVFCEICGFWGRVRCMKCGARVCGLECRTAHDESRCLKFYA